MPSESAANRQEFGPLPDDMDELDVWLAEHADLEVTDRVRELEREVERLKAKLAEYDKYVGEFTRHA